jgi:hypothetical protein
MTPDEQKFVAFESLLGWTAAVVTQAKRVSAARDKLLAELRQRGDLRLNPDVILRRLAQQFFQTERQLFCMQPTSCCNTDNG